MVAIDLDFSIHLPITLHFEQLISFNMYVKKRTNLSLNPMIQTLNIRMMILTILMILNCRSLNLQDTKLFRLY